MFGSVGIALDADEHLGPLIELLVFKNIASGTGVASLEPFSLAVTVHQPRDDFIGAERWGLLRMASGY